MQVEKTIEENHLFENGDTVGVGCSGGSDSVALLHYLAQNQDKLGIKVIAVHIDHCIREESEQDCNFVKNFAQKLGVRFYSFKIDVPLLASERGLSLETAGREARYKVFQTLKDKKIIDKLALAHHKSDQAETILMHILRGAGLSGAKGMEAKHNFYVRPFLDTSKEEIYAYLKANELEFKEDCTNADNTYGRNYMRNVILKDILARYPAAISTIVNFAKSVKEDDDYLYSLASLDAVIKEDNLIKIPLSYFLYPPSIINRILLKAFKELGITKDIERRHIDLLKDLAGGENGKKLSLPFGVKASKEYDYLTLVNKKVDEVVLEEKFHSGEIIVQNFGKIVVKKQKKLEKRENTLYIDASKLPKDAIWRFRKEGDVFTKFNGGSKKLKSYLIDKKVPLRSRKYLPLLAKDNEVYVIAGIEISDKVKVDEKSTNIYSISVKH